MSACCERTPGFRLSGQARQRAAPEGRIDLFARIGAWWEGRDYIPDDTLTLTRVVQAPREDVDTGPPIGQRPMGKAEIRLKALSLAWGAERFAPGSQEIDERLLGAIFESVERSGGLGFLGADPAILNACRGRTERPIFAAEWRAGCLDRERDLVKTVILAPADLDRPLAFPERKLEGLVSVDAFAFAAQKPSLITRAYKSLSGTGRWAVLDVTRTGDETPQEGFASAFARPQLTTAEDIDSLLWAAGFVAVKRENVTAMMVRAVRSGIAQMGKTLDSAIKQDLKGPDGEQMLRELAWDVQSWRARMQALEAGKLTANLWIADKDPGKKADAILWPTAPSFSSAAVEASGAR